MFGNVGGDAGRRKIIITNISTSQRPNSKTTESELSDAA